MLLPFKLNILGPCGAVGNVLDCEIIVCNSFVLSIVIWRDDSLLTSIYNFRILLSEWPVFIEVWAKAIFFFQRSMTLRSILADRNGFHAIVKTLWYTHTHAHTHTHTHTHIHIYIYIYIYKKTEWKRDRRREKEREKYKYLHLESNLSTFHN